MNRFWSQDRKSVESDATEVDPSPHRFRSRAPTVQVLPAVAHPANASGFVVTDDAALCEHVKGSYVYTDEQTVTSLERLFDTLRDMDWRKPTFSDANGGACVETPATALTP